MLGDGLLIKRVKIGCQNAVPVVVDTKYVVELAEGANVAKRNVKAPCRCLAANAGEGISENVFGVVIVKSEGHAVLRSATTWNRRAGRAFAECAIEPEIEVVAVVGGRGNVVEILGGSAGDVG